MLSSSSILSAPQQTLERIALTLARSLRNREQEVLSYADEDTLGLAR